jgi:hypothetical protein
MRGENGSSMPGFLSGLTLLILTGVGMSILVQRRFHSSDGNQELREQIEARELEIGGLRSWRTRLENQFDAEGRGALTKAKELRDAETAIREKSARLSKLRLTADGLREECDTLAASFDRYRTAYRTRIRQAAAGEKIGVLKLANGRQFTGASIVRVTDGAMEIVHDAGQARISSKDLAPPWSSRFQWDERTPPF